MFVCSCRGVTDHQILEAIDDGAHTVDAVVRCTRAGTGCGSCLDEIHALVLANTPQPHVASLEPKRHLSVVCARDAVDPRTADGRAA